MHYARSNASRIIIASRSLPRIQQSIQQLYRDVPTYKGRVDAMELDLSSFASVRAFVRALQAEAEQKGGSRLDIVLANAGVMKKQYGQTRDGYEEVLQVNGLATGLLAVLLMPMLKETAGMEVPVASKGMKPTMTIVASEGEYLDSPFN